jgi:iron complex outermembrane receptor protein
MMAGGMASNVRRTTTGGRVAATLLPADGWQLVTGFDAQRSPHDKRSGTPSLSYDTQHGRGMPSSPTGAGLPSWAGRPASARAGWAGCAWTSPRPGAIPPAAAAWVEWGMGGMARRHGRQRPRPQRHAQRVCALGAALASGATVYAGLGHVQRFPDYWELISPSNSAATAGNAFASLKPERATQLDVGGQWKGEGWQAWASGYAAVVQDYILFDYVGMASNVRNVDARRAGLELGAAAS